jgi:type IV secretion system protein VirB4
MLTLKEYRSYPNGFHSLLIPTELVGNGILLGKDGSLIGGFYLEGMDIASTTPAQRNHIAAQLNAAIVSHFSSGWVTSHELVRKPSAHYPEARLSEFPDAISQLIEAERRNHFKEEGKHFESANVLIVRYKSQALENPRLRRFFYQGKQEINASSLESDISHFERVLQSFSDSLSCVLKTQRMRSYHFVENGSEYQRNDLIT